MGEMAHFGRTLTRIEKQKAEAGDCVQLQLSVAKSYTLSGQKSSLKATSPDTPTW